MSNRVLVIGGPGTLSSSTINLLLEKKYEVAVFSRPTRFHELPSAVRTYSGDRSQISALQETFDIFKPDVVIDFICYQPAEADTIKKIVQGKVRQFVFISTVDVYGYPLSQLPMPESANWHPFTQSQYAAEKRLCEKIFHGTGLVDFPLTIVRPAYSFGPRFILSFTSRDYGIHLMKRLQDGRPILVPDDGKTLMHVSSANNTGEMIATLVDAPKAINNQYTCGHPTFTTHYGYVELLATSLNVKPNIIYIPTEEIVSFPDPEAKTCLLHALTRFNVAFSIDRFLKDFPEFQWQYSLSDWAKHVIDWNKEQGLFDIPSIEIFDDRVIASSQNRT
jgi:nucleoside-diphosphate-sugar epimerase